MSQAEQSEPEEKPVERKPLREFKERPADPPPPVEDSGESQSSESSE